MYVYMYVYIYVYIYIYELVQIYKDNVAMQFSYVIYENLKVCRRFQTIKPTNALMLNFFKQFVIIPTCFDLS